mgnify:CR=1 FL=1
MPADRRARRGEHAAGGAGGAGAGRRGGSAGDHGGVLDAGADRGDGAGRPARGGVEPGEEAVVIPGQRPLVGVGGGREVGRRHGAGDVGIARRVHGNARPRVGAGAARHRLDIADRGAVGRVRQRDRVARFHVGGVLDR